MNNYDYKKAANMPEGFNLKLTDLELEALVDLLDRCVLGSALNQVKKDLETHLSAFYRTGQDDESQKPLND